MSYKKNRKEIDMLHGPLGGKILLFALPLAATGVLQQLFNAADVMVVGRFCNKEAMAAVGSNAPIIGLLVNLFVGISMGANVVISRLIGTGDEERARRAVHTAVIIAPLFGVTLTLLGEIITSPLLNLMGVPDNVFAMSEAYLRIYLLGMPAILLYNFESAVFRSQGDTRTPLICLVIAGIINVYGNLFFVIVCNMTADGVALATVLSNVVSSLLMFIILTRRKGVTCLSRQYARIDGELLKQMLEIGVPAGVQGMVFSFSNIVIQSAINSLGADIMAASSAAFNIEIFAYYVINAFGQAGTTFTSQNYGANDLDRCHLVLRTALIQDVIATSLLVAVILTNGRMLLGLFNTDPVVIQYGYVRLVYILAGEFLNVLMEIFSGVMRGYGHSLEPALITLVGVVGVRIIWVYTAFAMDRSLPRLMLCYPLSWLVTAMLLVAYYFVLRKKISQKFLAQ